MSNRVEKVNEFLKEEVSSILFKILDPEMGFITVTRVETQPDLKKSTVYISILGRDKEKAFNLIEGKLFEIQDHINKRSSFKNTPKIVLKYDYSGEYSSRIEDLLKSLKDDKEK